ncbi:MAG: S-methyl-5'-thioinosine phosphorylase [Burkholderiales bacterium]|nr:S-methyl-5'-thioinosine phosphorylase [Burkholderiales bacterium]
MLGILGGSGMTNLADLANVRRQVVRTPYGEASGALMFGTLRGREIVFLARHGYGHTIPPHAVNYRANIWALASQGVREIVAIASVGGIRSDLAPGTLVVPSQILDYTGGRRSTYFDGADGIVKHIDFTQPYSTELRAKLLRACHAAREPVVDGGVYAAVNGPRLETAAEIARLERDGADMVGMTGMPEAALARESGVAYAALVVVANWAAGRADSNLGVSLADIGAVLDRSMVRVRKALHFVEAQDGGQSGA